MDWLLALFGPAGGLTGLIGGAVSAWFKMKAAERDRDAKRELRELDIEMAKLRMQEAAQETENEIQLADTVGQWNARQASFSAAAAAAQATTSQWVADLRSATRPILTFTLVGLAGLTAWAYRDNAAVEDYVSTAILYMATTAVGWWFGERGVQPRWAK